MKRFLILLLFLLPYTVFSADLPTVSVLYFSDLSPQKNFPTLAKTITEILITELASDEQIALIEREQLEKAMAEIALGQSGAIDESSAPKIGNLLSAHYILTGSYFIQKKKITITVKLINTEKGTIIGSDKITDDIRNFDRCFGKVASSSLEIIAKLHPAAKAVLTGNTEVSFETAVQFGNALDKKDKGELKEAETVLSSILSAAPDFNCAKITLEDVRSRLKTLTEKHNQSIEALKQEKMTFMDFNRVASNYLSQMKYFELLTFCMSMRSNPPEAPQGSGMDAAELVDYYLLTAAHSLRRWELVVREGERFLQKYSGSMYFINVKNYVQMAASEHEKRETNEKSVQDSIAPLLENLKSASPAKRKELNYHIGMEFMTRELYESALIYFKNIDISTISGPLGDDSPDQVLFNLFMCYYQNFDFQAISHIFEATSKTFPDSPYLEGMRSRVILFGD